MQKQTETNIGKVRDLLDKEEKYIKTGSIAAAVTTIAGTSVLSFFSFPYELLATTCVSAAGIGTIIKFLYDKLRMEETERELSSLSNRIKSDFILEQKFNNVVIEKFILNKMIEDLRQIEEPKDLKDSK